MIIARQFIAGGDETKVLSPEGTAESFQAILQRSDLCFKISPGLTGRPVGVKSTR